MYFCPMYSKELLKGTLEVILLKLLSEHKEMYGYEITQKVKEMTDGKILLKDGSLYPLLHKMLKDGKLSFREEANGKRIRKYYFLTSIGKAEKESQLNQVKDFFQTIQNILFPPTHSFSQL
jgi:PadR family transcriptional regulator PadR